MCFVVDGFSFGNADMDKYVDITIQSTLYSTNNQGRFRRFRRSRIAKRMDQSESHVSKNQVSENINNMSYQQSGDETSQASENNRVYGRSVVMHHSAHEAQRVRDDKTSVLDNEAPGVSGSVIPGSTLQRDIVSTDNDYAGIPVSHSADSLELSPSESANDGFQSVQSELDGKKVKLHCRVQVQLTTSIPPALLFIPNPVLGSVGRVILRAVLNALLPNFLELASRDYQSWVSGERTCQSGVGSLVGA